MAAPYIIQSAVVSFPYHGIDRLYVPIPWLLQRIGYQSFNPGSHRQGVRQDDRGLDVPQFLYLRGTGQFAEPVAGPESGRHFLPEYIPRMRDDGSHPGTDTVSRHKRDMTNRHSFHIGNGIQRSGLHDPGPDPVIPHPWTRG